MTQREKQKIAEEFIADWLIQNKYREDLWRRNKFGIFLREALAKEGRWKALKRGRYAIGRRK